MTITSSVLTDGKMIPSEYTCDGQNTNPPLQFSDIPPAAKSLALVMEDPDVSRTSRPDGLFIHWLVWNMPPTTTSIDAATMPTGVIGKNSVNQIGYTGPCPPTGEHRYYFRLYALDTELILPSGATKVDLLNAMRGHILDAADLMGRYSRST